MTGPTQPTFGELIDRAIKGTDADWDFVDANLGPHLTLKNFQWAVNSGMYDPKDNIRDLAATIMARSDELLDGVDQRIFLHRMKDDRNVFVRHWLANALYKRGNRNAAVVAMLEEACKQDTPAGEFARNLKAAA